MAIRTTLLLRALAVFAVSAWALLCASAATAAAPHTVVDPQSFQFEAHLPSSDGYSLYLRASGHRKVELAIGSEGSTEPLVTMDYRTVGRVDEHGIEADFGPFGRVELQFAGTPKRSVSHYPNCRPTGPAVELRGEMTGTFEFESLGGTVKLTTDRVAAGQTWYAPKRTCTPQPSNVVFGSDFFAPRAARPTEFRPLMQTFLARGHTMGRTIDLYAFKLIGEVIDMAATSTRRFGPVLVSTSIHAADGPAGPGKAAKLSVSGGGPRPRGATLTASTPFSGSGTFRKQPGQVPTWKGTLAVKIPGEGTLPLTGPDFRAIVCGYESTKLQRTCERTVAPPHVV